MVVTECIFQNDLNMNTITHMHTYLISVCITKLCVTNFTVFHQVAYYGIIINFKLVLGILCLKYNMILVCIALLVCLT